METRGRSKFGLWQQLLVITSWVHGIIILPVLLNYPGWIQIKPLLPAASAINGINFIVSENQLYDSTELSGVGSRSKELKYASIAVGVWVAINLLVNKCFPKMINIRRVAFASCKTVFLFAWSPGWTCSEECFDTQIFIATRLDS